MDNFIGADKLASWLAGLSTPLPQIATTHASLYASMRPALNRVYAEAGYPYGRDEDGMLNWWQKQAAAERERATGKVAKRLVGSRER